ncbi:MAG: ubiquitin-conjugating enzyme E2 [Solirubrobacteraceae bacterium]
MNPRLRRLQADYELVREMFSGHPHVGIEPIGTRLPPESYRAAYRLRGLYLEGDQPAYRDLHHVELILPRHYPAEKPYVVPLEPIFHPNIRDSFCIADYWAAGMTLADVVVKLGDMIQWRIYNTASPLDAIAAKWATEQEAGGLFPIGNVDLGVADFQVELRSRSSAAPLASAAPARDTVEPTTELELPAATTEASEDDDDLVVLLRPRGGG